MRSILVTITIFAFTTLLFSRFQAGRPHVLPLTASVSFNEACNSPELRWLIGDGTPSAAVATAGKGRFGFFGKSCFLVTL